MTQPILLIIGAGPNIGAHVAKRFASKGYRIALASRSSPKFDVKDAVHFPIDLAKPAEVPAVFAAVKEKLGASPSVVVYNAAFYRPDQASDVLSGFDFDALTTSNNINNVSVIAAVQQAVAGFKTLPATASKSFIFTGNILNLKTFPVFVTFGLGKNATAYFIKALAENKLYAEDGVKFYYADERKPDGSPVGTAVGGEAAAIEYERLAERKDQGPWLYTFVENEGYKDFEAAK